jgi:hypothetical protein
MHVISGLFSFRCSAHYRPLLPFYKYLLQAGVRSAMGSANSTTISSMETNEANDNPNRVIAKDQAKAKADAPESFLQNIPPGYTLIGCSLPFFMRAHYLYYHSPLDTLVGRIATKHQITMADLANADIRVKRAVGFSVAGRALKVATLVSWGSFGMLGAGKEQAIHKSMDFLASQY